MYVWSRVSKSNQSLTQSIGMSMFDNPNDHYNVPLLGWNDDIEDWLFLLGSL